MKERLRTIVPIVLVIGVLTLKVVGVNLRNVGGHSSDGAHSAGAAAIVEAIEQKRSNVDVVASGEVIDLLPDDDDGSRHQRFIVRLDGEHTVLIVHDIDLAKRVPVRKGDHVGFRGEYEYNDRGGLVHWTHHDPQERRHDGWIRYHGTTYK